MDHRLALRRGVDMSVNGLRFCKGQFLELVGTTNRFLFQCYWLAFFKSHDN